MNKVKHSETKIICESLCYLPQFPALSYHPPLARSVLEKMQHSLSPIPVMPGRWQSEPGERGSASATGEQILPVWEVVIFLPERKTVINLNSRSQTNWLGQSTWREKLVTVLDFRLVYWGPVTPGRPLVSPSCAVQYLALLCQLQGKKHLWPGLSCLRGALTHPPTLQLSLLKNGKWDARPRGREWSGALSYCANKGSNCLYFIMNRKRN